MGWNSEVVSRIVNARIELHIGFGKVCRQSEKRVYCGYVWFIAPNTKVSLFILIFLPNAIYSSEFFIETIKYIGKLLLKNRQLMYRDGSFKVFFYFLKLGMYVWFEKSFLLLYINWTWPKFTIKIIPRSWKNLFPKFYLGTISIR